MNVSASVQVDLRVAHELGPVGDLDRHDRAQLDPLLRLPAGVKITILVGQRTLIFDGVRQLLQQVAARNPIHFVVDERGDAALWMHAADPTFEIPEPDPVFFSWAVGL